MAVWRVLRQERKFLINAAQRCCYQAQFSQRLPEDKHGGQDGYMVRSLYFDTLSNRDLNEKLAGVETRRKLRLRIYSPDAQTALLEMKQKQGSDQLKRSLKLSREDAERIAAGDYAPLLTYKDQFAAECYGVMKMHAYLPKVIVEYQRKAYMVPENDIRITFDSKLTACAFCGNFFDPSLSLYPVLHPCATVLEVKYNHFLLGYIKQFLQECNKSETAVSKYVLARGNACTF